MRSTFLRTLEQHCPRALDFAESNTPYTRDVYAVGVAAHAVLQRYAEMPAEAGDAPTVEMAIAYARAHAVTLATKARSFDGEPEPPMSIDDAEAGATLAAEWYRVHGTPEGARAEVGLAVDSAWRAAPYGPSAHYRGILDLIWLAEDAADEESAPANVLYVRDYKSAWNDTDPTSAQLKGQALLARAWAEREGIDYDAVELQIGNLRTRQLYTHRIWNNAEGREDLLTWRSDLDRRIDVARRLVGPDGKRPARPGAGCSGCPWLRSCDAAQSVALSGAPEDLAVAWLAMAAIQKDREARIRGATAAGPIVVGGASVGPYAAREAEAVPDAAALLVRAWYRDPNADSKHSEAHALVSALDPGATSIRAAVKMMRPGREGKEAREALESKLLQPKHVIKFGVRPVESKS